MEPQGFKVLIADPDADLRVHLQRIIDAEALKRNKRAEVRHANDGATAMAISTDFEPSLICTEILLSGSSGLQLLRFVRQWENPPCVFFVSHMGRPADRHWGLRNGASAYLSKPVDEALFLDYVRKYLDDLESLTIGQRQVKP